MDTVYREQPMAPRVVYHVTGKYKNNPPLCRSCGFFITLTRVHKQGMVAAMLALTYRPKKRRRKRVHGFLKRMRSVGGARVLAARRRKKRKKLSV